MGREVTKEEAEEIIASDRHKTLINSLKAMATALSENNDKVVVDAINKQGGHIESLVNVLKNTPKLESPIVNVDIPQNFAHLIDKMCQDILRSNQMVINALENRILPDSFDLVKFNGITESVKVNYKEANKIKNKYNN